MSIRDLTTYRAKRDFAKTAEPSGKQRVARARALRFVIQKHAATRLHFDLRLELDGVFKSWAVTKGPSVDPAVKRLAVEVEDHPLDYGDFEGTIPKGQYGGGTVQLWDRGFWKPQGERTAQEMLAKGELKFELEGERLRGGWVLVRMRGDRDGGRRNNWLLIKHRDGFAKTGTEDALLEQDRSVASGRPMAAIASGRGARPRPFMGRGVRSVSRNAVWHPDRDAGSGREQRGKRVTQRSRNPRAGGFGKSVASLPRFVPPQLCTLLERPPAGDGWAHEVKFDGYRMQLRVHNGESVLRTRRGLDWTDRFSAIASAAQALPDCIVDGEIVALDHNGAPDFAALQAALSDGKTDSLVFFVFDLLFLEKKDLRALPLEARKTRLREVLERDNRNDALIRYVEHFETGGEAILVPRAGCPWRGLYPRSWGPPIDQVAATPGRSQSVEPDTKW